MSRNYNHSPNAEVIANRIRLFLLIAMIAMFSIFVINMNDSQGEQMEYQDYMQSIEKGEYSATLAVSTENGRVNIPVTFVVENDGEFGTVKLVASEKVGDK